LAIPVGTRFQFRNTSAAPLDIIGTTMPPWPGEDEAVFVAGKWGSQCA
jgi:mannose-6-phosphate isomerase-like protein (cupin superfamily)